MKRRKIMAYLILFSMIFSVLGGSINSQAKKNRISLNYKNLPCKPGRRKS